MAPRSRVQAADDDDDFHLRRRRNKVQRKKDAKAKKKARAEQAATKDCLLYQPSPRPAHSPLFNRTRAIAALKEAPETTHHVPACVVLSNAAIPAASSNASSYSAAAASSSPSRIRGLPLTQTFSNRTTNGRSSSANITVQCSRGLTVAQRIGATELGKHQEQESYLKEGREILSDLFAAYEEGISTALDGTRLTTTTPKRQTELWDGWQPITIGTQPRSSHCWSATSRSGLMVRTQAGWKWLQDLLGDRRGSMPPRIRRRHREASSKPSSRSSALVALPCRGARLRLIRDFESANF